jgi:hypothetical protein
VNIQGWAIVPINTVAELGGILSADEAGGCLIVGIQEMGRFKNS